MTSTRASVALEGVALALERIAAVLEERLPPIDDAGKIKALQAELQDVTERFNAASGRMVQLHGEIAALKASQPDLGVRCKTCGATITGIGAIAGAVDCVACHFKGRGL